MCRLQDALRYLVSDASRTKTKPVKDEEARGRTPSIEWEFKHAGQLLVATLECADEPALLESGKPGWYQVSQRIPWRFEWKFQVPCSVTELMKGYKRSLPPLVRPELMAQVEFVEWTPEAHLRHSRFLGLREDKMAADVARE